MGFKAFGEAFQKALSESLAPVLVVLVHSSAEIERVDLQSTQGGHQDEPKRNLHIFLLNEEVFCVKKIYSSTTGTL